MQIRLTGRASVDLEDIYSYTENRWGRDQADRYEAAIFAGLALLEQNPSLGRRISETAPERRILRIEKHCALYRVEADRVLVLRIVHIRRQPLSGIE